MRVKYAFFVDAAKVNQQDRFDVLGMGVDGVNTNSIPVMLPTLALIARIDYEPSEIGKNLELVIDCIQPDGSKRPNPVTSPMTPAKHPWFPGQAAYGALMIDMPLSEFAIPGLYRFRYLDGETVLYEAPFFVNLESAP
jgi:hypothetical protein